MTVSSFHAPADGISKEAAQEILDALLDQKRIVTRCFVGEEFTDKLPTKRPQRTGEYNEYISFSYYSMRLHGIIVLYDLQTEETRAYEVYD